MSPADRFWAKVDKSAPGECWVWTAHLNRAGYGMLNVDRVPRLAHRFAYELLVGPIPAGRELDHLCRNRACVNPAHLEPVTHAENMARGIQAAVTHCPQGHPYDEANTDRPARGGRRCRQCHRDRERARHHRNSVLVKGRR